MNEIKVSILVPVYNAEKYISRCAESIFEQTYNNLDIIFVNDKTPDKSVEKIKDVLNSYPDRKSQTKIINHNKNRGVAAARNTLLEHASGDYILWVDADDYINKNAVEILIRKVEQTNADFICIGSARHRKSDIIPFQLQNSKNSKEIIKYLLSGDIPTTLWGYFTKRELYINNKIRFVEGLDVGEDMLVLSELAYYARTITMEPTILYYWNTTNENSLVHNYNVSKSNMELKILDLLYNFFKDNNDFISLIKIRRVSALLFNTYYACLENNKHEYYSLKERLNNIDSNKIKNTNSFLYRFFLHCNNYFISRMWAKFIFLLKTIHHKCC